MNIGGTPHNLKPFRPGVSGNPGGRPSKRFISDRYERMANLEISDELLRLLTLPAGLKVLLKTLQRPTLGDAVALAQLLAATKGKTEAAKEVREAIEGRSSTRLEIGTECERGPAQTEEEVRQEIDDILERIRARRMSAGDRL